MWRLLLSVLLLATTVLGQDEPIQLYGFRGLNTIAGDFQLKPIDARKAHDVDFGRQLGTLMPRRGYDSISAMPNADSIVGIYGAYYSDGSQRLFSVVAGHNDAEGVSIDTTEIDTCLGVLYPYICGGLLPCFPIAYPNRTYGHFYTGGVHEINSDELVLDGLYLYCAIDSGFDGCSVRVAIYDADDPDSTLWTVEYISPKYEVTDTGLATWEGVDGLDTILTSGKKALAFSPSCSINELVVGKELGVDSTGLYVPPAGFPDPLTWTALAATKGRWGIKACYTLRTIDTSGIPIIVDTVYSTDTLEFGTNSTGVSNVYITDYLFGHFDTSHFSEWDVPVPTCVVNKIWVRASGAVVAEDDAIMQFGIYECSSGDPETYTLEATSSTFVVPQAAGEQWWSVDCSIWLDSGNYALSILCTNSVNGARIRSKGKTGGSAGIDKKNGVGGSFPNPLGSPLDSGTNDWCMYAEYVTYSIDTTFYDYGSVYATNQGSAAIDSSTMLWEYFSVQNRPSFAMLDDNVYIVNGSHKGVVYDGNRARPYPLQAPGEPFICPLSTPGSVNGEYRYMLRTSGVSGYANSVVSSPIRVNNGQVLLTRFQYVTDDSLLSLDSVRIDVYRTRGNPGPLDLSDSAFYTGKSLWIYKDSITGDDILIDDVADSSLSTDYKYALVEPDVWTGRDSTRSLARRYGSPTFVSSDTTHPDGNTLLDIFEGWLTIQKDTLGVAYVCTFIDTATGVESDTGRSLFVFCDSGNSSPSFRQVTLNLPKTIDTDTGIIINLYRACIYQQGYDADDQEIFFWNDVWYIKSYVNGKGYLNYWMPDTIVVLDYYLVGQFKSDDTLVTDSISFDSLSLCRRYQKQTAPPLMSKIFSYENRLFGIQKSGLYYSANVYADTLQSWGAMALTPINPDDGDMATTAWPARGVIRVMKSYSNYNVYQDNNLNWGKTEVSGYIGCVAGRSHTAGIGGHYYLSSEGVVKEVEGMNLERTQQSSLLSAMLDNFDQYDIADLSLAEAFYFDRKYMLCIGDTTYVYDERADAWSTWSLTFADATLYGTETDVRFLPGDSMYFIKSGSSSLYRFAGSDSDMTTPIEMTWKSGPFLAGPEEKRIYRIGRWISSTDAAGSVGLNITDEEGDSLGAISFSSLTSRYLEKGFGLGTANLFQVEITSSSPGTAIEKLDIYYHLIGRQITE